MNYLKPLFAFLFCFIKLTLAAQVKTIIPCTSRVSDNGVFVVEKSASKSVNGYLQFSLASLPADAVVTRAVLRLVLDSGSGGRLRVLGKCEGRTDDVTINNKAQETFGKGTEVELTTRNEAIFNMLLNDSLKSRHISFKILAAENNAFFRFYGSTPASPPDNWEYCNVPRLVIYYTTKAKPAAWAGYKADARHTSCSQGEFGPEGSVPTALKVIRLFNGGRVKNLTLDKGRLYFVREVSGSTILYAADAYTGSLKEVARLSPPEWMPSMSYNGYYYYTFLDSIQPINLSNCVKESPFIEDDIKAALTTGRDGSLYLCQKNYLKAYAPIPTRTLLWRFPFRDGTNMITSTPSLSTDDSFAYIAVHTADNKDSIRRINVLNKASTAVAITFSIDDADRQLTAPVIDNNGYIYQLDGFSSGSNLYVCNKSLQIQNTISVSGRNIAPPVCAGNYVYTVLYDTLLVRYRAGKDTGFIKVANGVHFMNTDRDGNVYILDKKNIFSVYTFKPTPSLCAQININTTTGTAVKYNGMLVSPDGAVFINSDDNIYSVVPDMFSVRHYLVTGKALQNGYTYRAQSIDFDRGTKLTEDNTFVSTGVIKAMHKTCFDRNSSVVLQARKGAILQDGVNIKKGASFSLKVGR